MNGLKQIISWVHEFWGANQVVDSLAKYGLSLDGQYSIFYYIPDFYVLSGVVDSSVVAFPYGFGSFGDF